MNDRLDERRPLGGQIVNLRTESYPLGANSASLKLIRRYAKRLRVTRDDVVLLGAQIRLEIKQHELGLVRNRRRPSAA